MGPTQWTIVAACVVLLVVLLALRRSAVMKGDIPMPIAIGGVVVAVLVAGLLLYRATNAPKAVAEAEGGEPAMAEGGGMGGGARPPSPHRELEQLVRKLALLRSQTPEAIGAEDAAKLLPVLKALAAAEGMGGDEAEAKKAELQGLLSKELADAVAAVELPDRRRRSPGAPPPQAGAEGGAPPERPPAGPGGPGGDRRAAMQARMLEIPYAKKLYDDKLAADPELATDEEKRSEFFRELRSSLSPFLRDPAKEALQQLVAGLSPEQ